MSAMTKGLRNCKGCVNMKKKMSLREKREAEKQAKKAAYSAASKNTDSKPAEKKAETPKPAEIISDNSRNKTAVKAAGLKSTIISGDKLYMTSFGKGNAAVIEQKIDINDYSFSAMKDTPSLEVDKAESKEISFSSHHPFVKNDKLTTYNPLYGGKDNPEKPVGRDMLGLKDKLEERYFGCTFNDNLHIQIIYNILDIEKILAVHSANITTALDHMVDEDDEKYLNSDYIGYMNTINTYDVFMDPSKNSSLSPKDRKNIDNSRAKFEKLLSTKRLGYFGFDYDANGKDKKKNEEIKKRLYHLTAFAGQLRQWSFHSAGNYPRTWLYKLDSLDKEYLDTLDHYFDKRFNDINDDFVTKNATNLYILKEVFPEANFKDIADLYYDFIVIKSHKNMGFSIKKLREKMLECDGADRIKEQDMDSVRSKLYKLIDFCIFKYYHEFPELSEKNVDILRAAVSDTKKDNLYSDEAARLWSIFKEKFLGFCDKIVVWVTGEHEKDITSVIDKDAYRNRSNVSYFSKLMYAMCFFLDGKEINDLLTTLINKFDNIANQIKTAKELGINTAFVKNYDFFNHSEKYVDELNIVKNIARMKKPSSNAKKAMYHDALTILGIPEDMDEKALDEELDLILEKKTDPVTGKPLKGKNPLRNFIANNVIENSRFIYLIKFCNPENVRKIVNNTKVTEFVLKRIPDAQIERYYKSCTDSEMNPPTEKKITELAGKLKDMNFGNFRNVRQSAKENMEKERFKAVIGLYLTVVYRVVKNLVDVNSRYIMAFHSLERDSQLYNVSVDNDYLALTDTLVKEGDNSRSRYLAGNKRLRDCVKQDIDNAKKWFVSDKYNSITKYRNNVAHLTAVRNCAEFIGDITKIDSYFALYHYLIQRQLAKGLDHERSGFDRNYPQYAPLFKWHTYVKDVVKALNAPFGYNIPRFKNLSIDALFDRNEIKKNDGEKKSDD